tara:strand:+ start:1232 stop:2413 length:1182 start_codon:yes stop_codon:yes gene_type:complete
MKVKLENRYLEIFACHSDSTKGRMHNDSKLYFNRTEFQRDRDRILHCDAFRRLKQKTQVFLNNRSDHYRTRLTHTLEVAQLARSISRYLHLNDDLSEAIALAHDLGHPPFGHAGENVLSNLMREYGGFDHNEQTLRIVTLLEKKYPEFSGLNLTYETLDGIVKHNGPIYIKKKIPKIVKSIDKSLNLELDKFPSAEAQVSNICDDIAYIAHDINDGLRSKLLRFEEIEHLPIIEDIVKLCKNKISLTENKILIDQIASNLINYFVKDLVSNSLKIFNKFKFSCSDEIKNLNQPVIQMNLKTYEELKKIKNFLFEKMYTNKSITEELNIATSNMSKMFDYLLNNPLNLPKNWHYFNNISILELDKTAQARMVCDYISGMTDNYFNFQCKNFNLN